MNAIVKPSTEDTARSAANSDAKARRRRKVWVSLLGLTTIPLALWATAYAINNKPAPMQSEKHQSLPAVTVIESTPGAYPYQLRLNGEATPEYELKLKADVAGKVTEVGKVFTAGAHVTKGELLFVIDATDYRAALASARQTLAEADYALQQEQREAEQAERDWRRSGIKTPASDLTLHKPQLASAKARLEAAQAAVEQASKNLARTRVIAPFDGVVVSRSVALGDYVNVGAEAGTLYSVEAVQVRLSLTQQQWGLLQQDLPDTVTLRSIEADGAAWSAQVVGLDNYIDASTRLRGLLVEVKQPLQQETALLPGSFVEAEIRGADMDNVLKVPASAVTAGGYLWYVDQHDKLVRETPDILFTGDDSIYVKAESAATLAVVRNPLAGYAPGAQVHPVRETAQ
ncbi:efflux RND transporter periplasmic adaptor subunit [Hahella aquimaris]|uniref:efflux RND transporter periplasmic adaptor subunit n=1 Tax=Hahella sp. HNIBRBA332 TaxID=3015983 RepID=UPI00273C6220|nr:efflux RND transporter periplasmic adaptor subunit [Hahella sp. HNIBRBA332]WLQ17009.1 efflux RND transporter periplasmic adaptor subunit [Hahella sp. HNIBRBA332]